MEKVKTSLTIETVTWIATVVFTIGVAIGVIFHNAARQWMGIEPDIKEIVKWKTKEVIKEVPVEVIKWKEVVKEVPIEIIKWKTKEVIKWRDKRCPKITKCKKQTTIM